MKKKTILVAAIAVMLVAALVVGGTLAYFTDTKTATNTFTTGKVSITLNEMNADNDIIATLTAKSDANLTFQAYACQAAGLTPYAAYQAAIK